MKFNKTKQSIKDKTIRNFCFYKGKRFYFLRNSAILAVLFLSFGWSLSSSSPQKMKIENAVSPDSLSGILQILMVDNFKDNQSESIYQLCCDDGKVYQLESFLTQESLSAGDRIKVNGGHSEVIKKGTKPESMVITDAKIELIQHSYLRSKGSTGASSYAIIMFNFRDDQRKTISTEEVRAAFFGRDLSANANIRQMSRGSAWLTGDIFNNNGQWYTIDMDAPKTSIEVSNAEFLTLARKTADKDIDFLKYKAVVYIFPYLTSVPWGAIGTSSTQPLLTDEGTLIMNYIAINGGISEYLVTHEVIHNFSVGHDSRRIYPEGRFAGTPTDLIVYGNQFSFEGGGIGHISAAFSKYIWPEAYNVVDINNAGLYSLTLTALADTVALSPEKIQGINIPVDSTTSWFIEYRDKIGIDSRNDYINNWGPGLVVTLRVHTYSNDIQTYIPSQDDLPVQDLIRENEEFVDPIRGLRVRALNKTAQGMVVEVEISQAENIRVNKRNLNWPDTLGIDQFGEFNFTVFNNSLKNVVKPFRVGLYVKSPQGDWTLADGQTLNITGLDTSKIINAVFHWKPKESGLHHVKILADDLNQLNELSRFDNTTPASTEGEPVFVPSALSDKNHYDLSSEVRLNQNYPNPFDHSTTISFNLPKAACLTLDVYDMFGRQIAVLASGSFPAGLVKIEWDATPYPGGVYVYRLKTDNFIENKKLIIRK